MNISHIIWFLVASIAAALPIPFIKEYTMTNNWIWIALSVISYGVLIWAYSIILRDKDITIVYPILKVLSILLVVLMGALYFYHGFDMQSILGIILGMSSVYILSSKI